MSTQPPTVVGETSVDSVGVGDGGNVSRIEGPPMPTSEVAPAATQNITLEEHCRTQYIIGPTITWNTQQQPGTVLFRTKIHPSVCGPIVNHLMQAYNTWGGSIDLQVKVAATGFHCGALAAVRIPPNIDPDSITTSQNLSVFPYYFVDAKEASPWATELHDQRRMHYHWLKTSSVDTSDDFGGWYQIFVMMPLGTSSTGLNQVNIQLFTRLGTDFVWEQVIPPSLMNPTVVSNPYDWLFPKDIDVLDILFRMLVTRMVIYTPTPTVTHGKWGMVRLNGQEYGTPYYHHCGLVTNRRQNLQQNNYWDQLGNKQPIEYQRPFRPKNGVFGVLGFTSGTTYDHATSTDGATEASALTHSGTLPSANAHFSTVVGHDETWGLSLIPDKEVNSAVEPPVVYNGESVVRFGAMIDGSAEGTPQSLDMCQTWNMMQALRHMIPASESDVCIKYQVSEKTTGLPIMYMKLYPEGFFTTTPVSQTTIMTYGNYKFEAVGTLLKTDFINNQADAKRMQKMARNFMLLKVSSGL